MNQQAIKLENMDESFSRFRLTTPGQVQTMQRSLESVGQLHPVIVRIQGPRVQLLDGFKRFYAARLLKWESLQCQGVEVDDQTAKVMILTYNGQGASLADFEQAQVVYSLKKEHLLGQEDIARLLGKSISWVSRRLSFIERLDESVKVHLRLGKITCTHARELARLPRGKQEAFLKLIVGHNLTSRQSGLLIKKYLQAKTAQEQSYLVEHPLEVIEKATLEGDIHDSRLSLQGNRLLKTSRMLGHYQHVFIGQSCNPPLKELAALEEEILCPGFRDIVQKTRMIQSILKSYHP
ncbi:MAG: ParB/RepB/Spo0J family partition protein [Candidatus Paceibacterota bacterium]|jgi:ParB family chromosome partitioning protein